MKVTDDFGSCQKMGKVTSCLSAETVSFVTFMQASYINLKNNEFFCFVLMNNRNVSPGSHRSGEVGGKRAANK